ncbi:PAP2 superfamily protein [Hoeflea halophila]|uniref:PAP2 superfamily protein n=1 Tax=Hoeflea halophila TaxID=714899 RepID=A0A286I042_9HYPH|nr:phosphatase PAP2 family protein [Hoeflea halophila]SOE13470.1 PAP2 superfamily protein [Hoeflea halophila]
MTRELKILRAFMWWSLLASGTVVMLLFSVSKVLLDVHALMPVASSMSLMILTTVICRLRGFIKSSLILEALSGGVAFSVLVLMSTYLAVSLNSPLADATLMAIDQRVGFDGVALIRFIDTIPLFSWALMHAYASFSLQLIVLPMLLILCGHPERAFALVLAYAAVGFFSSFVSIWFPALGAHVVYAIEPDSLASINPYFGHAFLDQFNAVREQPEFMFSLATAEGILTFPSVHAAVALICGVSAFSLPWLRYPFLALNALMGFSTLTHGGHYLVDVFAGFAVAALALYCVGAVSRMPQHKPTQAFQFSSRRSAG